MTSRYVVEGLECRRMLSASLIKDISTNNDSGGSKRFIDAGGTFFFEANDGVHGRELWKTDGTEAGTVMVVDYKPGATSFEPNPIAAIGSKVLLTSAEVGLWVSDGTAAGTYKISDATPITDWQVTVAGGKAYFRVAGTTASPIGKELWVSDGTSAGTHLVKDINPGTADAFQYNYTIVAANGLAFFPANDGVHGLELWRSDGTDAGTFMVKDLYAGSSGGAGTELVGVGGTLYFTGTNGTTGTELWKTNGALDDAQLVADVVSGSGSSSPSVLSAVGSTLYFWATTSSYGTELYKSNGTAGGTALVKDITAGGSSTAAKLYDLNGVGMFCTGGQLWRTNGTEAGTTVVHSGPLAMGYTVAKGGDALLFVHVNNSLVPELWRTDGTTAGTVQIAATLEPWSGTFSKYPLVASNQTVYFEGKDAVTGYEMYKVSPNATTATLVKDVNTVTYGSDTILFRTAGKYVYFLRRWNSYRLWRTDGTEAGTVELFDTGYNPYNNAVTSWNAKAFGDSLVFSVGGTLWITGATPGTQRQLFSTGDYYMSGVTVVGDRFYFAASESSSSTSQLWASDGNSVWALAPVIYGGYVIGYYSSLTAVGNVLFFSACDTGNNSELWRTDGTPGGTYLVKDINAGTSGSSPASMMTFNGRLYFTAEEDDGVRRVWTSDGTPEGTVRFAPDLRPVWDGKAIFGVLRGAVAGDYLYLAATTAGDSKARLWRTDGTAAGTGPVTMPAGTPNADYINELQPLGDRLLVSISNQLIVTDGTEAGTASIAPYLTQNTTPDLTYSFYGAHNLTTVGSLVYFVAGDNVRGLELYRTDGTAAGTVIVEDIYPGGWNGLYCTATYSKRVTSIAALGDSVVFGANDLLHGMEPWIARYDGEPIADAGTGYQFVEGQSVTMSGAGSRPGSSLIVKYEWDLDFTGGIFNTDVTGVTAMLGGLDGDKTQVVALRVTDAAGRTHIDISRVQVNNTPPKLRISGSATSVAEGSTFTLNLENLGDPGDDSIKSWTIAWGDGTSTTTTGTPGTVSHVYTNGPCTYSITASATDEDGSYTTTQQKVGVLDLSFGTAGSMVQPGSLANAGVAVGSDGRIVTVGGGTDFEIDRYLANGAVDAAFGVAGHVALDLTGGGERASDAVLYSDGRILVGGTATPGSGYDWLLARFLANGQPDPSFGVGGVVQLNLGDDDGTELSDLILLSDGRILAAGSVNEGSSKGGVNFAVARFLSDGQRDTAFGSAGLTTVDFGGLDHGAAIGLQSSGKIVICGTANYRTTSERVALVRLKPTGQLDTGPTGTPFAAGKTIPAIPYFGRDEGMSIAIGFDDKILVGGGGWGINSYYNPLLLRFLQDGATDTSFGFSSYKGAYFNTNSNGLVTGLALAPGGQIVYSYGSFQLARTIPAGDIDVTFGSKGYLSYYSTLNLKNDSPGAFLINPDGTLLVVAPGTQGAVLARVACEPPDVLATVTNIAPTAASIGVDRSVLEGTKVSFTSTFTDPGADPWVYRWRVTSTNGQVIADGDGAAFDFTPNDNGVYTVEFTVSDEGGSSTDVAVVTVQNASPTIEIGSNRTTNEGAAVSITGTEADPGSADILTRRWSIQYPDLHIEDGGTAATLVFTPPDNGVYTISVVLSDDDGGTASDSLTVTVNNVAPTVTVTAPAAVFVGDPFDLSLSATDPGTDLIYRWYILWGDGRNTTRGTAGTVQQSYSTGGKYTISVTPTDEDGTYTAVTRTIFVSPRPTLSGGVLTINGTTAADTLFVTATSDSLVVVINGMITSFGLSSVNQVTINLLDSDDALTWDGLIPGGSIDLGAGNDTFTLNTGDSAAAVTVLGNSGNDTVRLNADAARPVNFQGGTGTDTLLIYGTASDDDVTTSSTSSLLVSLALVNPKSATFSAIETFRVEAGAGNDILRLLDNISTTQFQLYGDDGNDTFYLGDATRVPSWAGTAYLDGKAGTDTVTINDQAATASITYTLSATQLYRGGVSHGSLTAMETITLNAGSLPDVINLTASTACDFNIDAGAPIARSPGDRLYVSVGTGGAVTITGTDSGVYTFTDGRKPVRFTGLEQLGPTDTTKPTVTASVLDPALQSIKLTFSENVLGGVDASDLQVTDLATGQVLPAGAFALTTTGYLLSYTTATWTPTTRLPNGNYRARIVAASLIDPSGNPMAADFTLDFFILQGDANRDRTVNFDDLVVVAQNYESGSGKTWAIGDFTGDGLVNFDDLVVVAQNYEVSPPAPAALPLAAQSTIDTPTMLPSPAPAAFAAIPALATGSSAASDSPVAAKRNEASVVPVAPTPGNATRTSIRSTPFATARGPASTPAVATRPVVHAIVKSSPAAAKAKLAPVLCPRANRDRFASRRIRNAVLD